MIDLHMHTLHSDGSDSVEDLLTKVQAKGLKTISITDHNSVGAYIVMENINVKDFYDGEIIVGIELNTKVLNIPIEILGYGIDYKVMNELLKGVYLPAEKRNLLEASRLHKKCLKFGLKMEENCVEYFDGSVFASKFILSEIMKYEENKAIIGDEAWGNMKVFYRKYMSNPEGPLYVEMDDIIPDFETAANLVRKAGRIGIYSSYF